MQAASTEPNTTMVEIKRISSFGLIEVIYEGKTILTVSDEAIVSLQKFHDLDPSKELCGVLSHEPEFNTIDLKLVQETLTHYINENYPH